jgi:hypothetical protein
MPPKDRIQNPGDRIQNKNKKPTNEYRFCCIWMFACTLP